MRRRARTIPSAPLTEAHARRDRTLVASGTWELVTEYAQKLFLRRPARGDHLEYLLQDAATGARSPTFDEMFAESPEADAISMGIGTPLRLGAMRISDGTIHLPHPRSASGEGLEVVRVDVVRGRPEVWLVARGAAGNERYVGRWNLADDAPVLRETYPASFTAALIDPATGALDVWNEPRGPAANGVVYPILEAEAHKPCAWMRFTGDAPGACVSHEVTMGVGPGGSRFGGRYTWDPIGKTIVDLVARTAHPIPGVDARSCSPLLPLDAPARLLIDCPRSGQSTLFFVFAPDHWWRFEDPDGAHDTTGDADGINDEPIWSLRRTLDGPTDAWLDLERGALLDAEPLYAVEYASQQPVFLAARNEGPAVRTLLRVDARAGTLEPLFTYRDCAGEISLSGRHGDRYTIACRTQPDPQRFVFRTFWNEVVDVAHRTRWREPGLLLGYLDDGAPMTSDVPANAWPQPAWFHRAYTLAFE